MYTKPNIAIWLCLFINFIGFLSALMAQPVFNSKQMINDWAVYSDAKNDHLYFYAPGSLQLAKDSGGRPAFQFLTMRYTGSSYSGDQGEKRFVNQLQFTVKMQNLEPPSAQAIRQALGGESVILRPFPIHHLEVVVFSPAARETDLRSPFTKIGEAGLLETDGEEKIPTGVYWTVRTYSLHLDNHEAQLLLDQVEKSMLALSISYAFFGEGMPGTTDEDITLEGDSVLTQALAQLPKSKKTEPELALRSLQSDAFAVSIDLNQWPEAVKKRDVDGADWQASYAALEIRCYDFSNRLRPDLFSKQLEIRAAGAGGGRVELKTQFLSTQPELTSRILRFPRAVRLSKPIEYRIMEISQTGEKSTFDWQTHSSWADLLDISTPPASLAFAEKTIEVEVDVADLAAHDLQGMGLEVIFTLLGQEQRQSFLIGPEESLPIKNLRFRHDKGTTVFYTKRWRKDGKTYRGRNQELLDNYIFLRPPGS